MATAYDFAKEAAEKAAWVKKLKAWLNGSGDSFSDEELSKLAAMIKAAETAAETADKPDLHRKDPDVLDLVRYELEEPKPPAFVVDDLVPKHAVTGLFGQDGLGKSLLGQHLLTSTTLGTDFFGHKVIEAGPALGWYCEETPDILAWRQAAVNRAHDTTFRATGDAGLELRGRLGSQNTLVRVDRGVAEPTPEFDALVRYCNDTKRRLVWLDHILHVVSGDICAASDVAKMLAVLARLAVEIDGAVVLAGHVSRAEGSEYLGSAMFSALCRSRLWLRRPKPEELSSRPGADPKNMRVLELAKANHAGLKQITLEWQHGAFSWLDDQENREAAAAREKQAEATFIRALRELDRRQRAVGTTGTTNAPKTIVEYALDENVPAEELRAAMHRLLRSRRIKAGVRKPWLKSNRMPATGLALAEDA
jgi:RecA-family ATPase